MSGNAFALVWRNPYVRAPVFFGLIALALWLARDLAPVLTVGLTAYLIAYLSHPLLTWLERRRLRRGVGIGVVLLIALALAALASSLLVAVGTQLIDLAGRLPAVAQDVSRFVDGWLAARPNLPWTAGLRAQLTTLINSSTAMLSRDALPFLQGLLAPGGPLLGRIFGVASTLAETVAVLILSVYMMADYEKIGHTLLALLPRPWQPLALDLSRGVEQSVGGYVRGQVVIALAIGTLVALGLALIGVPSALALGFLAGVFNLVPYLGVVIALVPALLLAAPLGWLKLALVVGLFLLGNQLEGHLLSPLILGRSTNLHPVTVALSILVGLHLLGLVGALVAVPLAALGKLLLARYYYPSRLYQGGP